MERLANRLAHGEEAAFAELYDACANRLHAWLAARLGSSQDAADVLQETFVRLVRGRARLAKVEDVTAYAFVVARNECARFAERRRKRRSIERQVAPTIEAGWVEPPADSDAAALTQAIAGLEAPLRDVVELKLYADLTFAQVAAALGIPPGTAATRYRAAVERLKTLLKKESV